MFGFSGLNVAREQAVAIASERVAHLSPDNKASVLALLNAAFEKWKFEQASTDGTIEIKRWASGGLLGLRLQDIAAGDTLVRIPAAEVLPEQCAGILVRSPADLFAKLSEESYPDIEKIRESLGYDIVVALLLERDGATMSPESIAWSVRVLWTWVWELGKAYRGMVVDKQIAQAEKMAALHAASATKRTREKKARDDDFRARATQIRKLDPKAKRFAVAETIQVQLVTEGNSEPPSIARIEEALKGMFR